MDIDFYEYKGFDPHPEDLFLKIFFGDAELTDYFNYFKKSYQCYLRRMDELEKNGIFFATFYTNKRENELREIYFNWKNNKTKKGILPSKKQLKNMSVEQINDLKKSIYAKFNDQG